MQNNPNDNILTTRPLLSPLHRTLCTQYMCKVLQIACSWKESKALTPPITRLRLFRLKPCPLHPTTSYQPQLTWEHIPSGSTLPVQPANKRFHRQKRQRSQPGWSGRVSCGCLPRQPRTKQRPWRCLSRRRRPSSCRQAAYPQQKRVVSFRKRLGHGQGGRLRWCRTQQKWLRRRCLRCWERWIETGAWKTCC